MQDTTKGSAPIPHFGRLTVLQILDGMRATDLSVRCQCQCGKTLYARMPHLVFGRITACYDCAPDEYHRLNERNRTKPDRCGYRGCTSGRSPYLADEVITSWTCGLWFCSEQCRKQEAGIRQWYVTREFNKRLHGGNVNEPPLNFGYLTVIGVQGTKGLNRTVTCECRCGAVVETRIADLVRKRVTGCPECAPITTRICVRCFKELPLKRFVRNNATRDGYHSYCKDCMSLSAKQAREVAPLPPPGIRCARAFCTSDAPVTVLAKRRDSIVFTEWFCSRRCKQLETTYRRSIVRKIIGLADEFRKLAI